MGEMTLIEALEEAVKIAGVRWPPCQFCGSPYGSNRHREVCKLDGDIRQRRQP